MVIGCLLAYKYVDKQLLRIQHVEKQKSTDVVVGSDHFACPDRRFYSSEGALVALSIRREHGLYLHWQRSKIGIPRPTCSTGQRSQPLFGLDGRFS